MPSEDPKSSAQVDGADARRTLGEIVPAGASRGLASTAEPSDFALLLSRWGTAAFLIFQTQDNVLSAARMNEFALFLAAYDYPIPNVLAPVVVGVQVGIALTLLVGKFVRTAGIILMGMFLVALMTVHFSQSFNLWWPALALVQFGAIFAAMGGGNLGLDRNCKKSGEP